MNMMQNKKEKRIQMVNICPNDEHDKSRLNNNANDENDDHADMQKTLRN